MGTTHHTYSFLLLFESRVVVNCAFVVVGSVVVGGFGVGSAVIVVVGAAGG